MVRAGKAKRKAASQASSAFFARARLCIGLSVRAFSCSFDGLGSLGCLCAGGCGGLTAMISGCGPVEPGSTPGRGLLFFSLGLWRKRNYFKGEEFNNSDRGLVFALPGQSSGVGFVAGVGGAGGLRGDVGFWECFLVER